MGDDTWTLYKNSTMLMIEGEKGIPSNDNIELDLHISFVVHSLTEVNWRVPLEIPLLHSMYNS